MYAVIETGGKQYKVNEGDIIYIEKLEVNEEETVEFNCVKAVSDGESFKVGAPKQCRKHNTDCRRIIVLVRRFCNLINVFKDKEGYRSSFKSTVR